MALKLAVGTRSGDTPYGTTLLEDHGLPGILDEPDCVGHTGLTAVDSWTVAEDRSTWRAL